MNDNTAHVSLIAILCAVGTALVIAGNEVGYWFFVGVVWVLMGVK